jgi:pimeloyl-ACP methyl ester carboxylesterase
MQQAQQDLQSSIINQVQQTFSNTIKEINKSNTVTDTPTISEIDGQKKMIQSLNNAETKKVRVGDIDMAYKMFGKGEPILLISGSGNVMDNWPLHLLQKLSSSHKVIIFDNRGVGNTTSGTKPFSINQFVNDTAGLMNALSIEKADVIGFSMASFIAQQLVLTHPEKVNRLVLYGASCGGEEGIPQEPWVVKALSDFVNNQTQDMELFLSVTFPLDWIKRNTNISDIIPPSSEIVPSTTLKKQFEINENWLSKNWSGICNQLTGITHPTMIISGTKDVAVPANNSLILTNKIPGAWLIQVKNAGHGLMFQYPHEFTAIVETFLNSTDKIQ